MLKHQEISSPLSNLNENYGRGWHLESRRVLRDVPHLLMGRFQEKNHCTITSLTSIFLYFRRQGFVALPSSAEELFPEILACATESRYYTPERGTFPWNMDALADKIWHTYGYPGTARNRFVFRSVADIEDTLKTEIDAGRPGIINFTHAPYANHTVTFYGYSIYVRKTSRGEERKFYLLVNNHWVDKPRYVDVFRIGEGSFTYFSLTLFAP